MPKLYLNNDTFSKHFKRFENYFQHSRHPLASIYFSISFKMQKHKRGPSNQACKIKKHPLSVIRKESPLRYPTVVTHTTPFVRADLHTCRQAWGCSHSYHCCRTWLCSVGARGPLTGSSVQLKGKQWKLLSREVETFFIRGWPIDIAED